LADTGFVQEEKEDKENRIEVEEDRIDFEGLRAQSYNEQKGKEEKRIYKEKG
jgi:hypothetical protein